MDISLNAPTIQDIIMVVLTTTAIIDIVKIGVTTQYEKIVNKPWVKKVIVFMPLVMFVSDFTTDEISLVQHEINGDLNWELWTAIFMLFPLVVSTFMCWVLVVGHRKWSVKVKCVLFSLILVNFIALPSICFSTGYPSHYGRSLCTISWSIPAFILLSRDIRLNLRGHNADIYISILFKLIEAFSESLPQAFLQLYIVCQYLSVGDTVFWWQWLTIFVSFLTLAYSVTTNPVFKDAAPVSKLCIFFVGTIGVISWVLVCCIYSMVDVQSLFYTIPIGWVAYTFVSIIVRYYNKYEDRHNNVETDSISNTATERCRQDFKYVYSRLLCFVILPFYDSFTLAGLFSSGVNFGLAVLSCFLQVPHATAISAVAVTLATLTLIANTVFVLMPRFKCIGEDWQRGLKNLKRL